MTTQEFSDSFDTLLNSHSIKSNFGEQGTPFTIELDEYEKSVFLTKAQEEIVTEFYNGKNQFGESFEKNEEMRRYLSSLISTFESSDCITGSVGVSNNSYFFNLPEDLMYIVYESADIEDSNYRCKSKKNLPVVPITHDEYHRIKDNPFRNSTNNRVLRLDVDNLMVELISKYNISRYLVRYIKKISPIILVNLEDVTIDGCSKRTECSLHPYLHKIILDRAVINAINSKSLYRNNNQAR